MTNSMQATLSKAAIYTKQPTREWEDPYLTWGCANVLLRLYASERRSERSNVLLLNMYESLWELYKVLWELLREVMWYKSCWRVAKKGSVIWELCEVWQFFIASQNILWIQTWELCEVWEFFIASQNILWIQTQTRKNMDMIKWQQTWPGQTNLVTTFKNRVSETRFHF